MRLRRCAILMLEPRERLVFALAPLAVGASGLSSVTDWFAVAAHIAGERRVCAAEAAALGGLSPTHWRTPDQLDPALEPALLDALVAAELVVVEGSDAAARDQRVRDTHWRCAAAVMHYASRWHGIDTEAAERACLETIGDDPLGRLGAAPAPVREHVAPGERQRLPAPTPSALDALLARRVTCRNFDSARALTQAQFSDVLQRSYGARAVDDFAPGVQLLKKGVPSAGGLHPTEAYLLVQRVEGIAPGLYHYHPVDHALEPLRLLDAAEAAALARRFVAAQAYFVDAAVFVIPVSRFRRNFWKYRNHAKSYRALILDVGHLSQTMYLAATELGLAAFITAAINEVDIEQAFGLDPLEEGPLAVTGFGWRGPQRNEVELDPLHVVWPPA